MTLEASQLLERYAAGERDFRGADLQGADLNNAKLTGLTQLSHAIANRN